jgi:hypothetical protein
LDYIKACEENHLYEADQKMLMNTSYGDIQGIMANLGLKARQAFKLNLSSCNKPVYEYARKLISQRPDILNKLNEFGVVL